MIRGIPFGRRFDDATFETYEVTGFNRKAYEACLRLARGESDGVVLVGPGGVGKTHLLHAVAVEYDRRHTIVLPDDDPAEPTIEVPSALELIRTADVALEDDGASPRLEPGEIEREALVDYWPMLDLAGRLRASALHSNDVGVSESCCTCDLLILDDLGHEKVSDFILQEVRRIIDWRYRSMLPIAIATNFTEAQIMEKYGEHTYSRWLGSCDIVEVAGSDYRRDRGPVRRAV